MPKITELPVAGPLLGGEALPIVQNEEARQIPVSEIFPQTSSLPEHDEIDGTEWITIEVDGAPKKISTFALAAYFGGSPVSPAPFFDVLPAITGMVQVGEVLAGVPGVARFGTISARTWLRNGIAIAGASGGTYLLTPADIGADIAYRETATGDGGTTSATSSEVGPVEGFPDVVITGPNLAVMGDSRSDNGIVTQDQLGNGFGTGTPMASRLQAVQEWLLHHLGYPMVTVAHWTLGGGKSSQFCHTHALDVIASHNPHAVIYLGTTNDPVDYTGGDGLASIPLGDPTADPATLARIGATAPVAPATGAQGTTLGNLDKMIRYFENLDIPVIVYEIPTESSSRIRRNADVHKWLQARKEAGTYTNLIAPNVYDPLLAVPGADADPATATGVWRSDIESTVGTLHSDAVYALHPGPSGARFLGEALAADAQVATALAGLPSLLKLPDATNAASFLNPNPRILVGAGNGTLHFPGSSGPAATGTVAESWEMGHNIVNGALTIVASMTPGGHGQRITVTRSGVASSNTSRLIRFRSATTVNITPVAGDSYAIHSEVHVPPRGAQDFYGAFPQIQFTEAGMLDHLGQSVSNGTYGAFKSNNPQPFPKDGDVLKMRGVPLIITPAMAASATGTIALRAMLDISFRDDLDTTANGPLVIDIMSLGIEKL